MSYQVKSLVFAPNLARISVKFNQAIHTPLNKQLLKVLTLKQGNLRQQVRRPSGYYEISASASFIITDSAWIANAVSDPIVPKIQPTILLPLQPK